MKLTKTKGGSHNENRLLKTIYMVVLNAQEEVDYTLLEIGALPFLSYLSFLREGSTNI
ncbi:MAG: hypothetical protein JG767_1853 [Deferribacteraceae bacterium]|jgi:hypothetical protein|nr:hypothetical protein [Deferribacteraceae bacterium]